MPTRSSRWAPSPGAFASWRWVTQDLTYSGDGRVLAATLSHMQGTGAATAMTSSWAMVWESGNPRRPVRRIHLADGTPAGWPSAPTGASCTRALPLIRHDLETGTSVAMGDAPAI